MVHGGLGQFLAEKCRPSCRTAMYKRGSPRVVVDDSTGSIKYKYNYYAFGGNLSTTAATNQPRRYTGKPFDDENSIDLYYYGARYYDPDIGRFLAIDPLASKYPGWSPYVYTLDNPINNIDPDGKAAETVIDVVSVGLSAKDFYDDPSWSNAGWLALDVAGAALPFVPAIGVLRHAGKIDNALNAMKRGLQNEKKVLKSEGLTKNTRLISAPDPKTGKMGRTIPDAIRSNGQTVDVKDQKYLRDSPQLRRQSAISARKRQKGQVIVGKKTRVVKAVEKRMDIKQRRDIGPEPQK